MEVNLSSNSRMVLACIKPHNWLTSLHEHSQMNVTGNVAYLHDMIDVVTLFKNGPVPGGKITNQTHVCRVCVTSVR